MTEIPAGEVPTQPGVYWMLCRYGDEQPEQWITATLLDNDLWHFPGKHGAYQWGEIANYLRVGYVTRIVGPIPEPDKVQG